MTDKEFDKKIGERLRDYREQPAGDVLSRIEQTLARNGAAVKPRRRVLPLLYRFGSVAAVLLLIVASALYLNRRAASELLKEQPMATLTPEKNSEEADNTPAQPEEADNALAVQSPEPTSGTHRQAVAWSGAEESAKRTADARTEGSQQAADNGQQADDRLTAPADTDNPLPEPHDSSATADTDNPLEKPYNASAPADTDTPFPNPYNASEPGNASLNKIFRARRNGQPSRYENRLMAQAVRQQTSPRQHLSASLYAGNFGAGTDNLSTREQDKVAYANMLIKQTYDDAVPYAYGLNSEDGAMMPVAEDLNTQQAELNHRMPVTAGLSLSVPLNERMSLITGLSYSYLYSSSSQNFRSANSSVTRELHYIGIPVGVSYSFYRIENFSLYVRGGGMAEKAVACRETYGISTSSDQNTSHANYRVKGVQLSVNLSAGASYRFSRNLGLYFEPGVSYYFPQRYQPANYRSVHPVNFSMNVGVRFGL